MRTYFAYNEDNTYVRCKDLGDSQRERETSYLHTRQPMLMQPQIMDWGGNTHLNPPQAACINVAKLNTLEKPKLEIVITYL